MVLALTEGENNAVSAPKKVLRIIYIFPTSNTTSKSAIIPEIDACVFYASLPASFPAGSARSLRDVLRNIIIDGKHPCAYSEILKQPIDKLVKTVVLQPGILNELDVYFL
jgi:hypothetical protein